MRLPFDVQPTVHENIVELRRVLGSAVRPLSLRDLAALLNDRDGRDRTASTIQRWERGAEPDYRSCAIMADLAGVPFDQFALGQPGAHGAARPLPTAPAGPLKRVDFPAAADGVAAKGRRKAR